MKKYYLIGALVIIVGCISAFGVWYTSSTPFCGTCHIMKDVNTTWKASSHNKDTNCKDCHFEPGVIGYIKAKTLGTNELIITLTHPPVEGGKKVIKTEVSDKTCMVCHKEVEKISWVAPEELFLKYGPSRNFTMPKLEDFTDKTSNNSDYLIWKKTIKNLPPKLAEVGLIFEHKKHIEALKESPDFAKRDFTCMECHSNLVHKDRPKNVTIAIPKEETCFSCHNDKRRYKGKVLSKDCLTCHFVEKPRETK